MAEEITELSISFQAETHSHLIFSYYLAQQGRYSSSTGNIIPELLIIMRSLRHRSIFPLCEVHYMPLLNSCGSDFGVVCKRRMLVYPNQQTNKINFKINFKKFIIDIQDGLTAYVKT